MNFLYRLFFRLLPGFLGLIRPFSPKLSVFLDGRISVFDALSQFRVSNSKPLAWFHVASLGEYEQARPVIAALKSHKPEWAVAVSFFSPSGYEIVVKKPQAHVDFITYLPLDRKSWADQFVKLLKPELAVFVKYDLWFHHIQALRNSRIPVFLISASLRDDQSFFGPAGGFFRQNLFAMNWIFTQNQKSIDLLEKIGITRCSIAGDTRFDRVAATAGSPKVFPDISEWIQGKPTVVVGSAWEEDMRLLIPLINSHTGYRWIVAPHELSPEPMDRWAGQLKLGSSKYSEWKSTDTNAVLFIDNIGMLSSLYQFARVAYVGGAFGKGLHNILEPLGFGVPVVFGEVKKIGKFPEAAQSELEGCGFSVADETALVEIFEKLEDPDFYTNSVNCAQNWVKSNLGASDRIVSKVFQLIPNA
jgi:3-deoxy-D-manno-octulosonic-acid transferase